MTTRATTQSLGRDIQRTIPDYFGGAFLLVLGGYLFLDKAFAWLHIPGIPVFAGEALLITGVYTVISKRLPLIPIASSTPSTRILSLFLVLGTLRLIWDFPIWGVSAARDGALFYYALIALLTAAYFQSSPRSLDLFTSSYGKVLPAFLIWAPIAMFLSAALGQSVPLIPDSSTSMLAFKPGNLTIHIAAGIAFIWLVQPPNSPRQLMSARLLTALGLAGLVVGSAVNRGGGIGALLILVGVIALSPHRVKTFYSWTSLFALLLLLAFAIDLKIDLGRREVSLDQLASNLESVVNPTEADRELSGTVQWRLEFWRKISDETLLGQKWLTGWGFGPNLAELYGFNTAPAGTDEGLRSAHNSHMSVLGRTGLPGLLLWLIFWVTWYTSAGHSARLLRRYGAHRDGMLLAWTVVVTSGFLLAAVFDPMLESPQVAVWVWFIVGLGMHLSNTRLKPSTDQAVANQARSQG